jgi:hypothetical protein
MWADSGGLPCEKLRFGGHGFSKNLRPKTGDLKPEIRSQKTWTTKPEGQELQQKETKGTQKKIARSASASR